MADNPKVTRLNKAAAEFNVGISTIVEFLARKGITIDSNPNAKISPEIYEILLKEYRFDMEAKERSKELGLQFGTHHETVTIDNKPGVPKKEEPEQEVEEVFIKGSSVSFDEDIVNLKEIQTAKKQEKEAKAPAEPAKEKKASAKPAEAEPKKEKVAEKPVSKKALPEEAKAVIKEAEPDTAKGPKVLGTIDLEAINQKTKPAKKSKEEKSKDKKKAAKAAPVEQEQAPIETKRE